MAVMFAAALQDVASGSEREDNRQTAVHTAGRRGGVRGSFSCCLEAAVCVCVCESDHRPITALLEVQMCKTVLTYYLYRKKNYEPYKC